MQLGRGNHMPIKLLIADDEDTIRNGMANYIKLHSTYIERIYLASNGKEAFEAIVQHRPDVMLLDIQMPIMNGIEVMEAAEKAGVLPYVIILSGYDEFKYAQQAIRFGAKAYLLKPCRSREIMQKINEIIEIVQGDIEEGKEKIPNSIVNEALEYINEHYYEELSLSEVAERLSITACYLSSLFSKYMKEGFIDYLNKVRIEHACIYLQYNQFKNYEIAFRVGFKDEKYFAKVFKKIMGQSPSDYRKNIGSMSMNGMSQV